MAFTNQKKGFKKFSKSRQMKRFTGFDGKTSPKPEAAEVAVEKAAPTVISDRERELASVLGDEMWAKQIVALQRKNPNSTVIEMLAMDWLDKNLADYVYQARVNGGYRPEGNVPDFIVRNQSEEWIALLINGNYWHDVPGTQNDTTDKLRLVGSYYKGLPIAGVVILWESRLMRGKQAVDEAMQAARQGVELGT